MKPKREYIKQFLNPLLNRIIIASNAKLKSAVPSIISELESYANTQATAPKSALPPNNTNIQKTWIDLAIDEIETLNAEGIDAFCSLTEAQWKTNGIMNHWHKQNNDRGRFFFRGEHMSNWNLVS